MQTGSALLTHLESKSQMENDSKVFFFPAASPQQLPRRPRLEKIPLFVLTRLSLSATAPLNVRWRGTDAMAVGSEGGARESEGERPPTVQQANKGD